MKYFSVFASFAAGLAALLLIFLCARENAAIENNGGIDSVKTLTVTYREKVESLRSEIERVEAETKIVSERLELVRSRENYKTEPTAFLTFDGGFTSTTAEIVDILDEHEIKGTFYVVGKTVRGNEAMRRELKEAFDAGHRIGIRSDSDDLKKIYSSEEAYFEDLYECRDLIKEITGVAPVLVRMPGGTGTAEQMFDDGVLADVLARLEQEGFIVNDWTTNSNDTKSSYDADDVASAVLSGSKKTLSRTYKTCLILFMNTAKAKQALPDVIEGMLEQGYRFSAVPTAFTIIKHR